jgi:hypothetical protein
MVIAIPATAMAHDPIFVSDDQTTPDNGPFMPDGSISWALYGQVLSEGDTRGFEFDLREGDEVFVSLLIPNISPEVELTDDELPIIELESPDGSLVRITPVIREVFDEPFSQTSYVTLAEHREPAQPGRYRGVIIGNAPARFSVAIGETEIFFTETERSGDRPTNFAEITEPLTAWYTTPPGGEQDLTALEEGEAQIDLEMIEEAMESGEAQAPDDAIEAAVDDAEDAMDDAEAAMADEQDALDAAEDSLEAAEAELEDAAESLEEAADSASESASATAAVSDDGGGTTWVAPVVIAGMAAVGAGYAIRRRTTS